MNEVDLYLINLSESRKEKFNIIIQYIREKYLDIIETCNFGPKTKFPVFKRPNSHLYVGLASRKHYITIHFAKYDCPAIIALSNKKIKTGVGCAKIPDNIPFPIEAIKEAIDECFKLNPRKP